MPRQWQGEQNHCLGETTHEQVFDHRSMAARLGRHCLELQQPARRNACKHALRAERRRACCGPRRQGSFAGRRKRLMPAPVDTSWLAIAGFGLSGMALGCAVRHLWGIHTDRANAARIAALCSQLDAKDGKLQALRVELQAEQARVRELQAEPEATHDRVARPFDGHSVRAEPSQDQALLLEDNEDAAFLKRRMRALESQAALDISPARRVG